MKNPIRIVSQGLVDWCADKTPAARVERTVAQGIIGIACAGLSSVVGAPEWVQLGLAPAVMVILSAVQAEIGKAQGEE